MTNIAERLNAREEELRKERIARRGEMLRKFVKEDLLKALEEGVEKNQDFCPVTAPAEIRHLFMRPLSPNEKFSIESPTSVYRDVWDELLEWAAGEGLSIGCGYRMSETNAPWAEQPWAGFLTYKPEKEEPQPQPPTPPETRKAWQGATITMTEALWGVGLTALITFLITFFSIRH